MKKWNWEHTVLIVIVLASGYLFLSKFIGIKNSNHTFVISDHPKRMSEIDSKKHAEHSVDLKTTLKNDIYYELSEREQIKVRRAVQYFCEINWHEDSCLHYTLTCGKKCFSYLKPSAVEDVRQAYFRRKRF